MSISDYREFLWPLFLGCFFSLLLGITGCKKEQNEPTYECEILISGMSRDDLESKGIGCGIQEGGESVVVEGSAGFETHRYSIEDIRVAAYMAALRELSEVIHTHCYESEDSKSFGMQSELAFGECIIKTSQLLDDASCKSEIEFCKANDLLYRFSFEATKGGGEVVSLKNNLTLSELMNMLADLPCTVTVISERATLEGRGEVKKDGGIDEIAKFNAVEEGYIEVSVLLKCKWNKETNEE